MTADRTVPVPDFPGYTVSDSGDAWSTLRGSPRKLRPIPAGRGRMKYALQRDGVRYDWLRGRLVLTAFVGPCPDGMECCHENDINSDDRLENLRWDTHLRNMQDSAANGLHKHGESHHATKLTNQMIGEARELRAQGWTFQRIADRLGVSRPTAFKAVKRQTWKHAEA